MEFTLEKYMKLNYMLAFNMIIYLLFVLPGLAGPTSRGFNPSFALNLLKKKNINIIEFLSFCFERRN